MLLTPEERKKHTLGWRKREKARKQALAKREADALDKAKEAADLLKEKYGVTVYLFGSLAWGRFLEKSDIDIALEGFDDPVNFIKIFAEVLDVASPYNVDLLLLQDIDENFRREIMDRGVIL